MFITTGSFSIASSFVLKKIKNKITSQHERLACFITTGSFSIASSFVLFFILLPFVLKKEKKKKEKNSNKKVWHFFISCAVDRYWSVDRNRGRAPYSGPLCGKITVQKRCEKIALWTAIGPWTAIGDGPLTGYFICFSIFIFLVLKNVLDRCSACPRSGVFAAGGGFWQLVEHLLRIERWSWLSNYCISCKSKKLCIDVWLNLDEGTPWLRNSTEHCKSI